MRKYSESDYYYSSGRIAAKSAGLMKEKDFAELCEMKDVTSAFDRIREFGIPAVTVDERPDTELTLTAFTAEAYRELESFLPDAGAVRIFSARYDCHNLKTAIKCRFIGTDPSPYFIDCGSIPAEKAKQAALSHDFSVYPSVLSKAAERADRELDESGSVRSLEIALDNACFAYMSELCDGFRYRPLKALLNLKIDLTNILTVFRLSALKNRDTARSLLEAGLLEGGSIPSSAFVKDGMPYDGGADAAKKLPEGAFERIKEAAKEGPGRVSAVCDRIFLDRTDAICGRELLGILPVARYIISLEYQIKNLRIILSGLSSGVPAERLREELRY